VVSSIYVVLTTYGLNLVTLSVMVQFYINYWRIDDV